MTILEYLNIKNEYDQSIREMKDKLQEYNYALVEKYPWCIPPNKYDPLYPHPDCVNPQYDYTWTMLDDMPDGWRVAFGDALCDEIQAEYEKLTEEQKKDFYIVQTKEKFGGLRMYMSLHIDSIDGIISKYQEISYKTCVMCGKPATRISTGWICPWCDECVKEISGKTVPIEEWFKES